MARIVIHHRVSGGGSIRAELVRDARSLSELRLAWGRLFDQACNATAPLHFDWIWNWWQINGSRYGTRKDALRVLGFWDDGEELVGVLPLYQRRAMRTADGGERLGFVSSGEPEVDEICPDYMDLLCRQEVREQCADLAWNILCHELGKSYDRLELMSMADYSPMVKWARLHSSQYDVEVSPAGVCPIADLTGGFEAYLGRLSANTRQQSRRLLRAADQAQVVFEIATGPAEAREYLQQLVDLHQARWQAAGEPGCFASSPFAEFHRGLVAAWVPEGRVILSRIRLGEQVLAVKYGFKVGDKYDFYQSGVRMDEGSPIKSPGIVSFLMLMHYLCGEEIRTFDFLRGSSSYKFRLATGAQPLVDVRRVLWTWRTSVGFAADLGGRAARRLVARIRRPARPCRHGAEKTIAGCGER